MFELIGKNIITILRSNDLLNLTYVIKIFFFVSEEIGSHDNHKQGSYRQV